MKPIAEKEDEKKRDPLRTKQSLISAGLHLFAERGFVATTIDQIAKRAKVNKALVSYYFHGKRGLQDAIHAEAFGLLGPRIKKLHNSEATAVDDLLEFIRTFAGLADANPAYPVMILRGLIAGETDPEGEFATHILELNQVLATILQKGLRSGCFRHADPLLTQVSILGSLLFFFATATSRERMADAGKLKSGAPSTGDFIEHLQKLVVRGLATEQGNALSDC